MRNIAQALLLLLALMAPARALDYDLGGGPLVDGATASPATLSVTGNSTLGDANSDTVISSGPVSINAGTPSAGTLVVKSTSPTAGNPIVNVQDSSGNVVYKVQGGGGVVYKSKTKAEFDALVPTEIGEIFVCADCTVKNTCISTGTAVAQWMRQDLATAGCGSGE